MQKINAIIIDDSALSRQLLLQILSQDSAFGNIDMAPDPIFALKKMEKLWPDVILLDIEMPRMNGIEFARQIMKDRPTPIVIISSKTEKNVRLGLEALHNGAVELIHKPELGLKEFLENSAPEIIHSVRAAAVSRLVRGTENESAQGQGQAKRAAGTSQSGKIIVIGASTGGTVALEKIIARIGFAHPGIVIVQHMPAGFTAAFADRLNRLYAPNISEARHGDMVQQNSIYIAPGGFQTRIVQEGQKYRLEVTDEAPVNRHKPSVDVLFDSAARLGGKDTLAVILTGMGADGAQGMLRISKNGGDTVAQDEQTSAVFGMPAEAIALGAARQIRPLDRIWEDIRAFSES